MPETIFVTYTIAGAASASGPTLGNHIALNYIDKFGVHRIIEAQPEHKFTSTIEKGKAFITEEFLSSGGTNYDSPFGRISANSPDERSDIRGQRYDDYSVPAHRFAYAG